MNSNHFSALKAVSIPASISILLIMLHVFSGVPNGSSYMFNLPWYEAFRSAFWAGDLYPRFLPDLWFGMGALDFYFYGPLPFWFAAGLGEISCIGCEPSRVFSVAGAWMVIFSGVTFYIFARRFFPAKWATFGGIIYAVLPYHYLMDWYVRQSIGEVASAAILPLIALATTKLLEERKGGILFALAFAALVLCHLPSALITIHLLIVIVTGVTLRQDGSWLQRSQSFVRFAFWGGLGAALSAFYWLPALGLLGSVSPEMLATDYYDPTGWLFLDGRLETVPHIAQIAKACLFLAVITAICAQLILQRTRGPSALTLWIIAPSAFTFFLMTVFSYPIWEFWIINRIQFPWRTLIVSDLSIGLSVIVITKYLVESRAKTERKPAILFAAMGLSALVTAYAAQAPLVMDSVKSGQKLAGSFQPVGVAEYIPPKALQPALKNFRASVTDEHSGTERYELFWLAVKENYEQAQAKLQDQAQGASLEAQTHDRLTLTVDLDQAKEIEVPVADWPHWRVRSVSGGAVSIQESGPSGFLTLSAPKGRSTIELYLAETLPQKVGSALSLASLLLLLGSQILRRSLRHRRRNKAFSTSPA